MAAAKPRPFKLSPYVRPEFNEQRSLVAWAAFMTPAIPELALLFAVPNGLRLPVGLAVKAKASGLKTGVPDLVLPVARHGFHGLFIEMKRADATGGDASPAQRTWIAKLREQGYRAEWCRGWEAARNLIINYLEGKLCRA